MFRNLVRLPANMGLSGEKGNLKGGTFPTPTNTEGRSRGEEKKTRIA